MNEKRDRDLRPLPPPPNLPLKSPDADSTVAVNPPTSIIEQLANLADKSEVMSLLEFKEEQQLDKNDPLWAFLLQFKTIENSVNKQEQILNLLIDGFEAKFERQINANQQRIDTSFRTYSQDLINQYQALTNNLQTVEEASLNLTQAKISGSVAKLVRHAAHTKAVNDWLAMSRLGLYILIPMLFAGIGGWFARSYVDYRYSNSGLSNADTALLHWAKSDEGKLAKDLARWNSRGLTSKGKTLICEQEAANLDVTLTLEGKSVNSGWCALWIRPANKR
ncbi:DUF6753 family protein [Myxosarcina sp. GI1]|uniref:DUF6753 family protein n=1 Tax=Myxosarcina sp. GI1 TaxID=1541065 RepID=UPI000690F9AE|nr:DUF6753 family protein [Myxosarcina sp. GI1]